MLHDTEHAPGPATSSTAQDQNAAFVASPKPSARDTTGDKVRAEIRQQQQRQADPARRAFVADDQPHTVPVANPLITNRNVSVYYGNFEAIKSVSFDMPAYNVIAMIGPSGCGKSTYLRSINRMNDLIDGCRVTGELKIGGQDVYDKKVDLVALRRQVGLVFQKPNPFPKSIYDNIAYGPRLQGIKKKADLDAIVEDSLRKAALWDEVKDRLRQSALGMSGGQQQRLCIARSLATKPTVLLMDEPASALDPISTHKVEELIQELKQYVTVCIVTHNMQQAARVSDYTAFFYLGKLIEYDKTNKVFTNPTKKQTEDYITGRFG